jgi:chromosome segregation ATPase
VGNAVMVAANRNAKQERNGSFRFGKVKPMRTPNMPFEEIVAAAERLQAEGRLSVRRLREKVGGGEHDRLVRAARQAREAAVNTEASAAPSCIEAAAELPEAVRNCLGRLEVAVLTELRTSRNDVMERARVAGDAERAKHQDQLRASEVRLGLLQEDLDEAEAEVARIAEERESLAADFERERAARAELEHTLRTEGEAHSKERLALTEALAAARDEAVAQTAARLLAEATASAAQVTASSAQATAAAAGNEVSRLRQDRAALQSRNEALVRQVAALEVQLNQATAQVQAAPSAPPSTEPSHEASAPRKPPKKRNPVDA